MIGRDHPARDVRPANAGGAFVVACPATAILATRESRGNGQTANLLG
jgi:hypothetical protein